jgi:hypothetical protein
LYSKRSGLILGFHGCDKKLRDSIISEEGVVINPSNNEYDWLGNGAYFWENNQERAMQFAKESKERFLKLNKISQDKYVKEGKSIVVEPAVLGVVIDLGHCLDLLDSEYLKILKKSHQFLCETQSRYKKKIPKNILLEGELMIKNLDCAVIQTTHELNKQLKKTAFDSVRGVFLEGIDLYENAGFKEKNHIQIAIRNPNCIKGYFMPRKLDESYNPLR